MHSDPDAAEDDGYLLSFLWDGREQKTYFVVFDARDVSRGPLHKLPVPTNVPFGLHGTFVPDLVFDHAYIKSKFEVRGA
jgi:carotenoid cleavage dioxygenase-like enzyme